MIRWKRFERAIVWSRKCWNYQTKRFELRVEKAVFGRERGNKTSDRRCYRRFNRFCRTSKRQPQYEKVRGTIEDIWEHNVKTIGWSIHKSWWELLRWLINPSSSLSLSLSPLLLVHFDTISFSSFLFFFSYSVFPVFIMNTEIDFCDKDCSFRFPCAKVQSKPHEHRNEVKIRMYILIIPPWVIKYDLGTKMATPVWAQLR